MHRVLALIAIVAGCGFAASAQTVDEIVGHYVKAVVGMDKFEGTDTYKLKVTRPNGDTYFYYLDSDYYMPIKIDTKRVVRGEEREYETALGDYKLVNGWYLPYALETNTKGHQDKSRYVIDKIEANVTLDDSRFAMPVVKPAAKP